MTLPRAIQALWDDLEAARADVMREVAALSQRQADWKPAEKEWSAGEVVKHLTIAEIATGKLTTKVTREAEAAAGLAPHPANLALRPLPAWPPGAAAAQPERWPDHANAVGE